MNKPIYARLKKLFLVFFKIGAFTFGGGYAMIPLIQRETSEKNKWIDEDEIIDIIAMVQSVPGVIAVNSSIYIGYKVAGILGSITAVVGVTLPSFIIILIIAAFLYNFRNMPYVNEAFTGIQAGVVALMLSAVVKLGKKSIRNIFSCILAVAAFVLLTFFDVNAVIVLALSAAAGIAYNTIIKRRHHFKNITKEREK